MFRKGIWISRRVKESADLSEVEKERDLDDIDQVSFSAFLGDLKLVSIIRP